MSKKEKLLQKLKKYSKDFTFEEIQTLLESMGFQCYEKGKTSGSRVKFMKGNLSLILHKPHPRKELLTYQVKQILEFLEKENLL
ncbi:MAG: type II toxin-antitoxin system HicA family toxin [Clostridiales bacterium]|jgi:hypothetical protein|nr:type II toxin-antitoxin system HicA family toxin [Clostridiales bacterium]